MAAPQRQRYEITKYPNRRFYDITSRRHVTLSDLYELVRAGHEIVVTDKNTGRDITNLVLTQIILEHDPPKMDLFPAAVLHQAIQMSESSARSFIDQYLGQAMEAFSQSKRQFDAFLRQTGLPSFPGVAPPTDWLRMMMPGF
ncbi:MAG: polyhydroxyalkanoate synthesis regulator DNA-binding domain-containing protein, partial [Phycisphaerales bacterium]|nr:polyhydroxyalkanoate synthesis regulator DNA-binding domain-containing protein [Phycisphaerales bacterium]